MTHALYLAGLLAGIGGLLMIDRRFKLAFWSDRRRTVRVIGLSMLFFIVWDLTGILFGVFFHGNSRFSLPFTVLPQFPLEEFFFLFLLCYLTLLVYKGTLRWRRI